MPTVQSPDLALSDPPRLAAVARFPIPDCRWPRGRCRGVAVADSLTKSEEEPWPLESTSKIDPVTVGRDLERGRDQRETRIEEAERKADSLKPERRKANKTRSEAAAAAAAGWKRPRKAEKRTEKQLAACISSSRHCTDPSRKRAKRANGERQKVRLRRLQSSEFRPWKIEERRRALDSTPLPLLHHRTVDSS